MYQNFKEIEKRAIELGPKKVAVLFPDDLDVLRSVIDGNRKGLIHPVLIGNRNRIEKVAAQNNLSLNDFEFIDRKDPQNAANQCIELVRTNRVSFVVKGKIITSFLYRSLIRHTQEFAPDQVPCTLCFHQAPGIEKIFVVTDPGVNVYPDITVKQKILNNAITVLHRMGCKQPKVMILIANHYNGTVSTAQKDADILSRLVRKNSIGKCRIVDSRNFIEAFGNRIIDTASFPDIFLVPNIDAGNILVKSIDHLGGGIRQCVTVGGGISVLTPSRSDGYSARIKNLALGVVLSSQKLEK